MKPLHWRRTRLGDYLRHLPRPKHLRGSWLHRKLGDSLLHPDLWGPRPHKIAAGFSLGAFFAMIPMPFQMLPTILLGYLTRVNLPAALVGVWISNPITTPPILYAQYRIGYFLMGLVGEKEEVVAHTWLSLLREAPLAILCGSMVTGVVAAALGYPLALLVWNVLSRWVQKARLHHQAKHRRGPSSIPVTKP
jgi:uncharacterized protein (DUF2062 family)